MKPSLPMGCFDWCVAPEHDFFGKKIPPNVVTSKGALNRVVPAEGPREGKLFLIGGPSKTHGYDENALVERIAGIAAEGGWELADSRRTPPTFLPELERKVPGITVHRHQETAQGWLAGRLSTAEEVWVTEDSVSMVYEALTGGAKVGILEMPRLRPGARVLRGLEQLEADGFFTPGARPRILAEADRIATLMRRGQA